MTAVPPLREATAVGDQNPPAGRRARLIQVTKVVFGLAVVAFAAAFIIRNWHEISDALGRASWGWVLLALVIGAIAQFAGALSLRYVVAGFVTPPPITETNRLFFVSQLGKYIPGSVWPVVALVEMCRRWDIPRRTAAAAGVISMVFSIVTGAVIGIGLVLASSSGGSAARWWLVLFLPVAVLLVQPRIMNAALQRVLRLARREPIEMQLQGRTLVGAIGWQAAIWLGLGLHCWALLVALGAPPGAALLPALGGLPLAYTAGMVFVPAPAGAGVREAVLGAVLATSVGYTTHFTHDSVVVVVLLSRVLLAGLDFTQAGAAIALAQVGRRRRATKGQR